MTALYVTSLKEAGGKSALCAGLGRRLLSDGKRVGFLKPLLITPREAEAIDRDAEFIKQVFALEEPAFSLCPVTMTPKALDAAIKDKKDGFSKRIQDAYTGISQNRDVVILEGHSDLTPGSNLELASTKIVELLDAKAVIVARYTNDLTAEQIVAAGKTLKERLLGVIINAVPKHKVESVKTSMLPLLQGNGIKVLGILPQDQLLFSFSVSELAEHLQGEVLNCPEHSSELVESLMVGAMTIDSGLDYFNRKSNKAVITQGNRADIQMAALETSTKCLILTGRMQPIPSILHRAEEKRVPIIVVAGDTPSTMASIEGVFSQSRFRQQKKLERLEEMLNEHFDFPALYHGLGLS